MLPALGALGALSGLLSSLNSASKSSAQSRGFSNPFETSAGGAASTFPGVGSDGGGSLPASGLSAETMNALLAAQSASITGSSTTASNSREAALKDLFKQIDADGNGAISKGEFESALGAGGSNVDAADKVFAKLDSDRDGSVSADELASALRAHKRHRPGSLQANGSGDPLLQALSGASSTSTTNADGSVTTAITYADGSKVSSTSPATGSASSRATASYNFIEQLIQRQAAQLQAATTPTLSVSA